MWKETIVSCIKYQIPSAVNIGLNMIVKHPRTQSSITLADLRHYLSLNVREEYHWHLYLRYAVGVWESYRSRNIVVVVCVGGVIRLWVRPSTGLLFNTSWYMSEESHGGMILTGETRRTRIKICPTATLSTTNSHTYTNRERTQASAVRVRQLRAWAMARPPWRSINKC
jgi:hypothetical protein